MAAVKKVKGKDIYMGKLRHGADLLEELTEICVTAGIELGRIEAIGAVQRASVGFYNQEKQAYEFHVLEELLEITNLTGNVSIKEGSPFVHAHVTLSDSTGRAYGGHLAPGTIIFACECIIQAFEGPLFKRALDKETGLPLWTMEG